VFMGEYEHSVDAKGRLILPAKFREELGDTFIATRGLEHCLFIYPLKEWAIQDQKLEKLSLFDAQARAFKRYTYIGAAELEVDKQGRVLIPQHLRQYAKLDKDVIVAGVSNRVEVWNKENWQQYNAETEANIESLAAKLIESGI
jgi:MraZ protein